MSNDVFPAKGHKVTSKYQWSGVGNVPLMSFTCGFCGNLVSNREGYQASVTYEKLVGQRIERYQTAGTYIQLCHVCSKPNYFSPNGAQYPLGVTARSFKYVPDDLVAVYLQAQKCLKAECLGSAVMVARRLLMVLAWRLQAADGLKFQEYVDYFVSCGAISPAMKAWVDQIRKIGNASTHEIPDTTQEDAQNVLRFVELIFDNVFEAPGAAGIPSPFTLRPS